MSSTKTTSHLKEKPDSKLRLFTLPRVLYLFASLLLCTMLCSSSPKDACRGSHLHCRSRDSLFEASLAPEGHFLCQSGFEQHKSLLVRREVVRGGAWVEIEARHTPTVIRSLTLQRTPLMSALQWSLHESYHTRCRRTWPILLKLTLSAWHLSCVRPRGAFHAIRGFSQGAANCAALS